MPRRPPIRLPRQWPEHVQSAVLHAIGLASVAEDFRVKRAGVFLRRLALDAEGDEQAYEEFVGSSINTVAPLTFAAVTVIMLALSAAMLWTTAPHPIIFLGWLSFVVATDAVLVVRVTGARRALLEMECALRHPKNQ